jgi:large subunit ribosomal protein L29
MKIQELRTQTPEMLKKQLAALREQARDLQFRIHSQEIKNNHLIKVVKKDIARILTLLNQPESTKNSQKS